MTEAPDCSEVHFVAHTGRYVGRMTRKKIGDGEKQNDPERWLWVLLTGLVLVAAGLVPLFVVPTDSGAKALEAVAAWVIVIGLAFGGVGMAMRACAHGAKTRLWTTVDGIGKLLSVGGWGVAFLLVVFYRLAPVDGAMAPALHLVMWPTLILGGVLSVAGVLMRWCRARKRKTKAAVAPSAGLPSPRYRARAVKRLAASSPRA